MPFFGTRYMWRDEDRLRIKEVLHDNGLGVFHSESSRPWRVTWLYFDLLRCFDMSIKRGLNSLIWSFRFFGFLTAKDIRCLFIVSWFRSWIPILWECDTEKGVRNRYNMFSELNARHACCGIFSYRWVDVTAVYGCYRAARMPSFYFQWLRDSGIIDRYPYTTFCVPTRSLRSLCSLWN